MLRRYHWWSLLLLNWNVIYTRSNWLCWKAQESGFCKTTACSYVTLLSAYLAKKKLFKVSSKNIRKTCLSISKITLKTSERRHLTTSCLSEAFIPRIYTNFQSKVCFQFCFQVRRPAISTIVDSYMSFYEK